MKKYFLYIILFFGIIHFAHADLLRDDTTKVELRTFDSKKIERYQNNPKYDYEVRESWLKAMWKRFLEWLSRQFGENVGRFAGKTGGGDVLNAIIAVLAVVLLIFGLSKVKFRSWVTGKGAVVEQEYTVEEENIHEIEFDKDIRDAENDEDYRRAIRLLFLKGLKQLSDAELIYWDPNKTNYQYLYELKGTSIYTQFVKCVNIFELVWYGERKIDQAYYLSNKPLFEELSKGSGKVKTAVFNG